IKVADKYGTRRLQDRSRFLMNGMVYASTVQEFDDTWCAFVSEYEHVFPGFLKYFKDTWYDKGKYELWSKAFRSEAPFHTNNLIESYHDQRKTFYLGRSKRSRMDRTIYVLSQVVVLDYRQDALQVLYGIKQFSLTKPEKSAKNVADEYDVRVAASMISVVDDNDDVRSIFLLKHLPLPSSNTHLFFF
ncbi:unnamed protein product, partial [Absidia cylindrospora]